MASFLDYCKSIATEGCITDWVDTGDDVSNYQPKLGTLINTMKSKLGMINRIDIAYIRSAVDKYNSEVSDVSVDIDNSIIKYISNNLFNKEVTQLTNDEAAITKVLAVYTICK